MLSQGSEVDAAIMILSVNHTVILMLNTPSLLCQACASRRRLRSGIIGGRFIIVPLSLTHLNHKGVICIAGGNFLRYRYYLAMAQTV
jgi:hypothetical protein